jgi:hypothetical protein
LPAASRLVSLWHEAVASVIRTTSSGPSYLSCRCSAAVCWAIPASCQSDTSRDAAGNPTAYEPANAHDEDLSTAWRCDGSGVGQRFTVQVPAGTVVGEVGLVPGYAKTDPATGVDRYAENNRITRVRWTFDDGSTFVQRMSGSADDRRLRTRRVPATETGQVVVEILASEPGPRDTVAISEIRVAAVDAG